MLSKISCLGSNYAYNMLKREQNLGSNYAYMLKASAKIFYVKSLKTVKNSRVAFKLRSI